MTTYENVITARYPGWLASYADEPDPTHSLSHLRRNLEGVDGRAATVRSARPWVPWAPPVLPVPQAVYAAVYDVARQVVLAVTGGATVNPPEVWEYDNGIWLLREPTGPRPGARSFFGLAYDPAQQRVLLVGGYHLSAETPFNDLWSWNGTSWEDVTPTAGPLPPPGSWERRVAAYDSGRGRLVLVYGNPTSTWEWDGVVWMNRTPPLGPAGLQSPCADASLQHPAWLADGATAVYDPGRQRVVLVNSGNVPDCPNAGTWAWDGSVWERLAPVGHSEGNAALAYDSTRGRLIQVTVNGRVLELDAAGWSAGSGPDLLETSSLRIVYDSARQRLLFLDVDGAVLAWNGASWVGAGHSGAPPWRRGLAMTSLPDGSGLLVFGGQDYSGFLDDAWEWHGTMWVRFRGLTPPARAGHTMTTDAVLQRLVLFGGEDSSGIRGDTWELSGGVWQPIGPANSPPARTGHAMVFDAARGVTMMWGGRDASTTWGDHWQLLGSNWTLVNPAGDVPSPRWGHAMAYDPVRERVVMFGGEGGPTAVALDDTWEWDGTAWARMDPLEHPEARTGHALAYDPAVARVVLLGGRSAEPLADTWEWNGSNWRDMSPNAPVSPVERHAMASDPIHGRLLVQGPEQLGRFPPPDRTPLAVGGGLTGSVRVRAWCGGRAAAGRGARLLGAFAPTLAWEELAANQVDANAESSSFPQGVAPLDSGIRTTGLRNVACAPLGGGPDALVAVDYAEVRVRE